MRSRPRPLKFAVAILALVLRFLPIATTTTRVMQLAITSGQEGLITRITAARHATRLPRQ